MLQRLRHTLVIGYNTAFVKKNLTFFMENILEKIMHILSLCISYYYIFTGKIIQQVKASLLLILLVSKVHVPNRGNHHNQF